MELTNFKWDQDSDGIVTLVWDMPNRSLNVLSMSAVAELTSVAGKLKTDPGIKGLGITSGKPNGFFARADLDEMGSLVGPKTPAPGEARIRALIDIHPPF